MYVDTNISDELAASSFSVEDRKKGVEKSWLPFIHSFIHFLYFPSILLTRYGKRHVHNTNSYRNIYLKKIKNKQSI